jgi:hypothetical protein
MPIVEINLLGDFIINPPQKAAVTEWAEEMVTYAPNCIL